MVPPIMSLLSPRSLLSPVELNGVDEDEVALGVQRGGGGRGGPGACPHFAAAEGLQVGEGEEL